MTSMSGTFHLTQLDTGFGASLFDLFLGTTGLASSGTEKDAAVGVRCVASALQSEKSAGALCIEMLERVRRMIRGG